MKLEARARLAAQGDTLIDKATDPAKPTDDGQAFKDARKAARKGPALIQDLTTDDGSLSEFYDQDLLNNDLAV